MSFTPTGTYRPAQLALAGVSGKFNGFVPDMGLARAGQWPGFERGQALRLIEAFNEHAAARGLRYDHDNDCFEAVMGGVNYTFGPYDLWDAAGARHRLYFVGQNMWRWTEVGQSAPRAGGAVLDGPLSLAEQADQVIASGGVEVVVAVDLDEVVALNLEGLLDLLSERLIGSGLLMDTSFRVAGSLDDTLFIRVEGQVDLSHWAEELAAMGIDWKGGAAKS